jgi:hypothetical protein
LRALLRRTGARNAAAAACLSRSLALLDLCLGTGTERRGRVADSPGERTPRASDGAPTEQRARSDRRAAEHSAQSTLRLLHRAIDFLGLGPVPFWLCNAQRIALLQVVHYAARHYGGSVPR